MNEVLVATAKVFGVLVVGVLAFPLFLLMMCLFGIYLWDFIERVRKKVRSWYDGILWIWDDTMWGFADGPKYDYHERSDNHNEYYNVKADVKGRMDALIKELIRAKYCKYVLHKEMLSYLAYEQRMSDLRNLETMYPELSRSHSPTKKEGHDEAAACLVFGEIEWYILRRTLELIKPETVLKQKNDYESLYSELGGEG